VGRSPSPLPFSSRPLDIRVRNILASLYEELERETARRGWECSACGACCRFREYGHELWLTDAELAFLVGGTGRRRARGDGACPYLDGDACAARECRALGCRAFFCRVAAGEVEGVFELYFKRLREVLAASGNEPEYGELLATFEQCL
jgi:Fe-S-cluster containining protein